MSELPGKEKEDSPLTDSHSCTEAQITPERYQLGALLGEGGMATVINAEDKRLQRTVAVKRLKPALADDKESRQRFFEEAQIIGKLGSSWRYSSVRGWYFY